jgi:C-5 cytosine-specific DNA methylase
MRMLDLFCGRFGWGKAFAARGWEVVGVDLVEPPEIPEGCTFIKADILQIVADKGRFSIYEEDAGPGTGEELWSFQPDFVCASSPCENFSIHGMKHFHPNPPYPEMGLKLFTYTKQICEESGVPFVMENVRAAKTFVGPSVNNCGSFHLWGSGVPAIVPSGIKKGMRMATGGVEGMNLPGSKRFRDMNAEQKRAIRKTDPMLSASSVSAARKEHTAKVATIPPELANCVADYAERVCAG